MNNLIRSSCATLSPKPESSDHIFPPSRMVQRVLYGEYLHRPFVPQYTIVYRAQVPWKTPHSGETVQRALTCGVG